MLTSARPATVISAIRKANSRIIFTSVQSSLMPGCIAVPWIAIHACVGAARTSQIPGSSESSLRDMIFVRQSFSVCHTSPLNAATGTAPSTRAPPIASVCRGHTLANSFEQRQCSKANSKIFSSSSNRHRNYVIASHAAFKIES